MYKVVIVDDEPAVLKYLRYVINDFKLPLYICAEGQNGEEAIDLAHRYKPDFLIIDVCMPVKDGLAAAEQIKQDYPHIKIYLLTAHEQFDYARKGIRIGVEDYLLKPISPEQLSSVLQKGLGAVLEAEIERKKAIQVDEQMEELKPALREQVVYDMVFDRDSQMLDSVVQMLSLDNLDFSEVVIGSFWNKEFKESLAEELVQELDSEIGFGLYTVLPDYKFVILCNKAKVKEIDKLVGKWEFEREISISGGMTTISRYDNITHAFIEANKISNTARFWLQKGFISSRDMGEKGYSFPKLMVLQKEILNLMLGRQVNEAFQVLKKALVGMENLYCPPEQVVTFAADLVTLLLGEVSQDLINDEQSETFREKITKSIEGVEAIDQLEEGLKQFLTELNEKIVGSGESPTKQSIKYAVEYINQNCHSDLNLEKVAGKLYLSPSYFSRAFKKHTGRGFASYLVEVRMEKAYKLLLSGKFNVAQVAEKVGYHDSNYFSSVFKKQYNIPPSQVCGEDRQKS